MSLGIFVGDDAFHLNKVNLIFLSYSCLYNTNDIDINSFFHNFNGRLCNINSFFIYFTTQSVKAPSQYFNKEDRILCPTGTVPQSGYSCVHSTVLSGMGGYTSKCEKKVKINCTLVNTAVARTRIHE